VARGVTPPERADRIERTLDGLELGREPLGLDPSAVLGTLQLDKKHSAGALRWVLPTEDRWAIDADVPEELVREVATSVLAGRQPAVAGAAQAPVTAGRP
jgi:3-dehydroquinate synthetase